MTDQRRIYFFDNAKFILITLVVLAHFISPLQETSEVMNALGLFINTFHMPAFIFISGYLAKSYIREDGGVKIERVIHYIILYFVCQAAVAGFERALLGEPIDFSLFYARTSLWFLQCLVAWYLMLPLVTKFKPWIVIVGSILIGFIIGYDTTAGHYMSVQRTLNHFPFFIIGYYMSKDMLFRVKQRKIQVIGAVIFVLGFYMFFLNPDFIPVHIIASCYSYKWLTVSLPYSMLWCYRMKFYIVSVLLVIGFLAFVPVKETWYTKFGARSLQVYIWHRFLYLAELQYGWGLLFDSPAGRIAMIVISILCTYILSLKVFSIPFDAIASLNIKRLFRETRELEN